MSNRDPIGKQKHKREIFCVYDEQYTKVTSSRQKKEYTPNSKSQKGKPLTYQITAPKKIEKDESSSLSNQNKAKLKKNDSTANRKSLNTAICHTLKSTKYASIHSYNSKFTNLSTVATIRSKASQNITLEKDSTSKMRQISGSLDTKKIKSYNSNFITNTLNTMSTNNEKDLKNIPLMLRKEALGNETKSGLNMNINILENNLYANENYNKNLSLCDVRFDLQKFQDEISDNLKIVENN